MMGRNKSNIYLMLSISLVVLFVVARAGGDEVDATPKPQDPEGDVEENELLYNKGSACGYCTYCKFCKLCDKDCPCQKSALKPNCHLCKYCKFCYLCKLACDTVCQPGGIIDRVSSSIYSQLPKFNKAEVDKDIDEVKDWIDKVKEEL